MRCRPGAFLIIVGRGLGFVARLRLLFELDLGLGNVVAQLDHLLVAFLALSARPCALPGALTGAPGTLAGPLAAPVTVARTLAGTAAAAGISLGALRLRLELFQLMLERLKLGEFLL